MVTLLAVAVRVDIKQLQVWLLHRELHIQLQLVLVGPEVLIQALLVCKVLILHFLQ
jgi:hypothetical protein